MYKAEQSTLDDTLEEQRPDRLNSAVGQDPLPEDNDPPSLNTDGPYARTHFPAGHSWSSQDDRRRNEIYDEGELDD